MIVTTRASADSGPRVYNKKDRRDVPREGARYVGRPDRYGNPFVVGRNGTRDEVCDMYARWLDGDEDMVRLAGGDAPTRSEIRRELAGRDLVCWCAPERCHADLLLAIANEHASDPTTQPSGDR